ncbi:MAG TPA: hypothetical protein PK781_08680 [Terrimesophilobacter sp.]|nr:hypothetical protein [Terrimesophilobacter sp.]HRQ00520.1 hypothetical protein [Terrimesophilobacter sp.]
MSKRAPRGQLIELGGEPRINFLPPEIQDRKDARRRRRALFMLVLAVAVLCGIAYFYSAQYASEQQAALEAEQQTTLDLLAQQTQYSEASALAKRVQVTHSAATITTSTEVLWRDYIGEITQALPAGVSVQSWSLVTASSIESTSGPTGLFPVTPLVTVDLQVTAGSLTVISAMMDSLANVTGVDWVTLGTVTLNEGTYETSIRLTINADVYETRFADGWEPGSLPVPIDPADSEVDDGIDASADDGTANDDQAEGVEE